MSHSASIVSSVGVGNTLLVDSSRVFTSVGGRASASLKLLLARPALRGRVPLNTGASHFGMSHVQAPEYGRLLEHLHLSGRTNSFVVRVDYFRSFVRVRVSNSAFLARVSVGNRFESALRRDNAHDVHTCSVVPQLVSRGYALVVSRHTPRSLN